MRHGIRVETVDQRRIHQDMRRRRHAVQLGMMKSLVDIFTYNALKDTMAAVSRSENCGEDTGDRGQGTGS